MSRPGLRDRCPHKDVVRTTANNVTVDVCLAQQCRRIRAIGGKWRDRIKSDGIDSRWIIGMRKSLGLDPGPDAIYLGSW